MFLRYAGFQNKQLNATKCDITLETEDSYDCRIASEITDLMVQSTTLKSQQIQTKFQRFAYFLGRSVNTFWGEGYEFNCYVFN